MTIFSTKRLVGLFASRSGNFTITTALALPVLLGAAGVAIDVSNMVVSRSQLQQATDASALATATALANGTVTVSGAPQLGIDFVTGQMANSIATDVAASNSLKLGATVVATPTTTANGTSYAVKVSSSYSMTVSGFSSVLGWKTTQVVATSTTTSGTTQSQTALSMILALDQSGSMADNTTTVASQTCVLQLGTNCLFYNTVYVTKIAALKQAATALFNALDTADPKSALVRTGAVSYNSIVVGQTKNPTMDWGTTAARRYVNAMPTVPTGGTDATGAMTIADAAVKKISSGTDTETIAQAQKGNAYTNRYIVLMTDGEMTGSGAAWNQALDQSVRDKCTAAKADGITIFSVAFMAPAIGKSLLQFCASSTANYYEPATMDTLVAAFQSIAKTATNSTTLLTN